MCFILIINSMDFYLQVRVWETDKDVSQANDTEVLIGHSLETTITNLTPGKTYYLRVLAYSQVIFFSDNVVQICNIFKENIFVLYVHLYKYLF